MDKPFVMGEKSCDFIERVVEGFSLGVKGFGLIPTENQTQKVRFWTRHLLQWKGRKVTGLREPEEIAVKVISDSFGFLPQVGIKQNSRCVDVGTGNGWPGLAFNVVEDSCKVVFMDSRLSAVRFLQGLCREEEFPGMRVVWERAEDAGHSSEFREGFDVACSRAMADPFTSLEYSGPFVRPGGMCLLWLGPEEEGRLVSLNAWAENLGFGNAWLIKYTLSLGMGRRILACYPKLSSTDETFPRRNAVARRKNRKELEKI